MTTAVQTQTAISGCTAAVDRCLELVSQTDDRAFSHTPEGHGSIGEHLRHCIDHFVCFFRDFRSGRVNYDARERSADIETDRAIASAAMQGILHQLSALENERLDQQLVVYQTAAPDESPIEMNSSLSRELVFLSGHTVHHLALMVLIAERAGGAPSTELGVAYSTTAHRASRPS